MHANKLREQCRLFYLIRPGKLPRDQFAIHTHFDLRFFPRMFRDDFFQRFKRQSDRLVLGHIVCLHAEELRELLEDRSRSIQNDRARACGTRIPPGAPIRVDNKIQHYREYSALARSPCLRGGEFLWDGKTAQEREERTAWNNPQP